MKGIVITALMIAGTLGASGVAVAIREIPRAHQHSEAAPARGWNAVASRVLAHPVKSGEPVLLSHTAQGVGARFSSQLAAGTRALTIPVDDPSSISGMVMPGDHVDIFFTMLSGNESVTVPLLLDVPVIATDMHTATNAAYLDQKRPGARYNTVTVSVALDDVAKITLAQEAGKITIRLRQPSIVRIGRVTKQSL